MSSGLQDEAAKTVFENGDVEIYQKRNARPAWAQTGRDLPLGDRKNTFHRLVLDDQPPPGDNVPTITAIEPNVFCYQVTGSATYRRHSMPAHRNAKPGARFGEIASSLRSSQSQSRLSLRAKRSNLVEIWFRRFKPIREVRGRDGDAPRSPA